MMAGLAELWKQLAPENVMREHQTEGQTKGAASNERSAKTGANRIPPAPSGSDRNEQGRSVL